MLTANTQTWRLSQPLFERLSCFEAFVFEVTKKMAYQIGAIDLFGSLDK